MKISEISRELENQSLEDYNLTLEKLSEYQLNLNRVLLEDFSQKPNVIKADLLFKYVSLIDYQIREVIEGQHNLESCFFLAYMLYKKGDKSVIPVLLDYIKSNDLSKSIFVISKLSQDGIKEIESTIYHKLEHADFNDQTPIVTLLDIARKMKIKLPSLFIKKIPKNPSWGLKMSLKEGFGIE